MARLDQLGPVKEVAQLASCLGREFSFEVLLAVSPLVEAELGDALRKAVDAEVFYQRGTPPEATYLFKHALIQEAAYASLLRSTRQRHHARIAETLAQRFPELVETRPELLAHHYAEGGEPVRAVELFHRAGQRGIERAAPAEAVRHLRRALALLEALPLGPARDGRELGLQTLLGLGLVATEGYGAAQVERAFSRAAVLCRALGESEGLFPVLFGHWMFRMVRAEPEAQLETAERLVALAEASGSDDLALEAHLAMGMTCNFDGKLARARGHLEQVLALYDPERHAGHAFVYGQDPAAWAAATLGQLLWIMGWPDAARRMDATALAVTERVGHPFTLAGILGAFIVGSSARRGEHDEALERVERAVSICEEQGFPMFLGLCQHYEGYALLYVRREQEALKRLRDGLAAIRATGSLVGRTVHLCEVAEACLRLGETPEGLATLDDAETFVEKHHEHHWEPEIHRLRGELLLQGGAQAGHAENCFHKALEIARAQEAKSFELRAAMSLARLRRDQGRRAEARDLLQAIYAWFTEGCEC
jgi:predicted ATPase